MKAIIIAAGLGGQTGLPTPLSTVRGRPLIVSQLLALARAGIADVVINQQAGDTAVQGLLGDGSRFGVRIAYSIEPAPLGSAGAIAHALPLLGAEPFVALAGNLYCPYFDFEEVKNTLEDKDVLGNAYTPEQRDIAWLYLHKPAADGAGDFALQLYALNNDGAPRHAFIGIGVYRPELFYALALIESTPGGAPPQPVELLTVLRAQVGRGQVGGEIYPGDCVAVDTPEQLARLNAPSTGTAHG